MQNLIQKNFQALLQKEMSRQQFLVALFMLIASFVGLSGLMGALTQKTAETSRNPGYGEKNFGP